MSRIVEPLARKAAALIGTTSLLCRSQAISSGFPYRAVIFLGTRCVFPFRFRRQASSGPRAIGDFVIPGRVDYRLSIVLPAGVGSEGHVRPAAVGRFPRRHLASSRDGEALVGSQPALPSGRSRILS